MALLPELDTRSVLDVVEENFQQVGLKAYAIRMIYTGEHTLPKDELIVQFKKTIQAVNSGYCEIHVNGLFLVYDSYFVHILEGSEDTVHRQLRFLFQREIEWIEEMKKKTEEDRLAAIQAAIDAAEEAGLPYVPAEPSNEPPKEWIMLKRMKILMVYHSIKTLIFDNWRAVKARPPSLVGRLDTHGPLSAHMEQLRICLDKITKLCGLAKMDDLNFEGVSAADPKMDALPEVALLEFLLQSPHVLDHRNTLYLHRRVDDYTFYFESVWPLPTHFTPRLLYKLKIDDSFVEPLPVMPWEMVKKEEKEDEEREERQSVSSDSD